MSPHAIPRPIPSARRPAPIDRPAPAPAGLRGTFGALIVVGLGGALCLTSTTPIGGSELLLLTLLGLVALVAGRWADRMVAGRDAAPTRAGWMRVVIGS